MNNYKIDYPYHLCPVCGMQSETTSRVCSKHINVTYDQYGNVIRYTDYYPFGFNNDICQPKGGN